MSKPRRPRAMAPDVSEVVWAHLTDQPLPRSDPEPWDRFTSDYFRWSGELAIPTIQDHWNDYGEAIVEEWIRDRPGTRPSCWWEFDAPRLGGAARVPEPRWQVGGSGVPASLDGMALKFEPFIYLRHSLPSLWATRPTPDDPPLFEAQATFLKRHGLLEPGEAARLTAADYQPEVVQVDG